MRKTSKVMIACRPALIALIAITIATAMIMTVTKGITNHKNATYVQVTSNSIGSILKGQWRWEPAFNGMWTQVGPNIASIDLRFAIASTMSFSSTSMDTPASYAVTTNPA